ncbi:MAG: hypothetical protein JXB19_10845 [Bacteroidales bacterium]|nr:hypothetical protein [Bacteroidales bacterium]
MNRVIRYPGLLLFLLILTFQAKSQTQQQPPDTSRRDAIRLFMDCQGCDMNYIREEMPYVNYVRDVREAQVYLLITRQSTGSGGTAYTLLYSGQDELSGMKDTLIYNTSPDDTYDVTRSGLTNTIALGLMRYVAKTPIRNAIQVRYTGERLESPEQVEDKWNYWVFEIQTRPRFSIEKSVESYSLSNSLSADRVTPEWKIGLGANHSYSKNVYIRERKDSLGNPYESRTEAIRSSWSANNETVKSLSNHWSVGFRAGLSSSTYNNIRFKGYFMPAIEYNIFPYSESTRRQLRAFYSIGYIYNNYTDTTIYNKTYERLFEQSLSISFRVQQSWGSANASVSASNYLHDFQKNNVRVSANLSLRIFKGLSLSINGGMAFIHDQIELAKGNVSDQQLYLRTRALETGFQYDGSLGITYTFGSIYSNIVNPRF